MIIIICKLNMNKKNFYKKLVKKSKLCQVFFSKNLYSIGNTMPKAKSRLNKILREEEAKKISLRERILNLLKACERNTLDNAFERLFSEDNFSTQEKAYITHIGYQIFRYKLKFDALIRLYCHKYDALSEDAKNILLIALTEMYCMQSIPVHASVNEAVKLAKKYTKTEVPLINAVLRKIDTVFPFKDIDKALYMKEIKFLYQKKTNLELEACYHSLPSYILDILRKQYGKEYAENYLVKLNEIPWYSYRYNIKHTTWQEKRKSFATCTNIFKEIAISGASSPARMPNFEDLYDKGEASSQGSSSQLAVETMYNYIEKIIGKENARIWDTCSGVGGKSLALAELGLDIRYASDTSEKRIYVYEQEAVRLGVDHELLETEIIDMREKEVENVNCIILDAPCSGTGTLTTKPDLRYKINKKSMQEIISLQEELLECAYNNLQKDGLLCYITCSFNKAENEEQIEKFSTKHKVNIHYNNYILPQTCGADTLYLSIIQKI